MAHGQGRRSAAAQNVAGKKAIAVEAFARALQQLPTILADNAGLDSERAGDATAQAVYGGLTASGLDLATPAAASRHARAGRHRELQAQARRRLVGAEAAEVGPVSRSVPLRRASNELQLLLRVDNIIRSAPRKRERM